MPRAPGPRILVAGNYCHDTLVLPSGTFRTLGGSAAYIGAALAGENVAVVAKAGEDFRYAERAPAPPLVVRGPTTAFVNDLTGPERSQRLTAVCEPVRAPDLGRAPARVGLAVGVAMEILPETLRRLRDLCAFVVVDAQALLRARAPDGRVLLRPLSRTPFARLLDCVDLVKASAQEAPFLDVAALRRRVPVLVTEGPRGCLLLDQNSRIVLPTTPVPEVDATGAGDCFTAGLAQALARGRPLAEAARLANRWGGRAVGRVGLPAPGP